MTSQNGYPTSPEPSAIDVVPFVIAGVSFPGGVRHDIATMLGYVAIQFHRRVEALHAGWCWGWAYRPIRGASALSNHASGTAIDFNAPNHPMGGLPSNTFNAAQIAAIHQILRECGGVVRWGGDYVGRADSMHFEIVAGVAAVTAAVRRLPGHAPASVPPPPLPAVKRGKRMFGYILAGDKTGAVWVVDNGRRIHVPNELALKDWGVVHVFRDVPADDPVMKLPIRL